MNASKITAAVLSEINDGTVVTEYGHGYLVSLPLCYFDGDRVKLFIDSFENGFRVTDRGVTLMRLHMADLNMATPRVVEAYQRSLAGLDLFSPREKEEIASWAPENELGSVIMRVAEASLRIDQLRWLSIERRSTRFPERVISQLVKAVGRPEEVLPQAPLPQLSGRTRKVTAAVGISLEKRIYVQAVGGGNQKDAQEKSVEHCFYLFQLADGIPRQRRMAIVAGRMQDWSQQTIDELRVVSDVAFFDDQPEMNKILQQRFTSGR